MNDGIPTNAIQNPCQAPITAPASTHTTTATGHGMSLRTMRTADIAPMNPATDPTDRSMWPLMITMTIPMASTRM